MVPPDIFAAVEDAYRRHRLAVFRVALAASNDPDEAEDLTQEAFDRLLREASNMDWSRSVEPWLVTVVHRLSIDRFRRLRRWGAGTVAHPSAAPSSLDHWIDVKSKFAELTSMEREALILTAVLGFTGTEASRVLGVSDASVRAAVSRARRKLEG